MHTASPSGKPLTAPASISQESLTIIPLAGLGRAARAVLAGRLFWAAALLALAAMGCAAFRTGLVEKDVFASPEHGFRLRLTPGDWEWVKTYRGDLQLRGARYPTIAFDASCSLPETRKVSLKVLTLHLLIGLTERKTLSQRQYVVGGEKGLMTEVEATIEEGGERARRRMLLVVVQRGRCVYDFLYVADPQEYAARVEELYELMRGLEFIDTGGRSP